MGIRSIEQIETHPLRGSIFETFIIAELLKSQLNRGERPAFYFWRDSNGNEIDLIFEDGTLLRPIEIKSGRTLTRDSFAGLEKWCKLAKNTATAPTLIYAGDDNYLRREIKISSWQQCGTLLLNPT